VALRLPQTSGPTTHTHAYARTYTPHEGGRAPSPSLPDAGPDKGRGGTGGRLSRCHSTAPALSSRHHASPRAAALAPSHAPAPHRQHSHHLFSHLPVPCPLFRSPLLGKRRPKRHKNGVPDGEHARRCRETAPHLAFRALWTWTPQARRWQEVLFKMTHRGAPSFDGQGPCTRGAKTGAPRRSVAAHTHAGRALMLSPPLSLSPSPTGLPRPGHPDPGGRPAGRRAGAVS
jgi:hypothetical protein